MGSKKKSKFLTVAFIVLFAIFGAGAVSALVKSDKKPVQKEEIGTLNERLTNAAGEVQLDLSGENELIAGDDAVTLLGSEKVTKIVLNGSKDGATIKVTGSDMSVIEAANGAELVFQNVTLVDETPDTEVAAYENYVRFGGKIRFESCTLSDSIYLTNDVDGTFKDCSFHSSQERYYSVWVADGSAAFENCTFTGYRGLKTNEFKGDDVVSVAVDSCIFDNIALKPGIAIGTFSVDPMDTTVSVKNCTFKDCWNWDVDGSLEGVNGFYEADMPTDEFNFVSENNTINRTEYKITYKAVLNGTVTEIESGFWKAGGKYPTTYVYGDTIELDKLSSVFFRENEELLFTGWYRDSACTIPFDGQMTSGDVTLYAKLITATWSEDF